MELISDETLNKMIHHEKHYVDWAKKNSENSGTHALNLSAFQELKERREADKKPLDIKQQVRIVHDKCPDVWKNAKNNEIIMDVVWMEYEEAIKDGEK